MHALQFGSQASSPCQQQAEVLADVVADQLLFPETKFEVPARVDKH